MKLRIVGNIAEADYSKDDIRDNNINQIINNTLETWQIDRTKEERASNTKQGKIAEAIVETYIKEEQKETIDYLTYDKIRNDNYQKHAPFDFLIWKKGTVNITPIIESIKNDIFRTEENYVRLSNSSRNLCKDNNVKIVEVKSTKIRQEYKDYSGFNGNYYDDSEVIKLANYIRGRDDVFCYPHYKRSESTQGYSLKDYCEFVKSQEICLAKYEGEELQHQVLELERNQQCCDVFIRVYLDLEHRNGLVLGWIDRERLLDYDVKFKRMMQKGKSENALYFAKSLVETNSITCLGCSLVKSTAVYANPNTRTNFYHKKRDCKFLSYVNVNDIISYASEAEAIASGRYTQRCKSCFEGD